jgi:hypothetical protein
MFVGLILEENQVSVVDVIPYYIVKIFNIKLYYN